MTSILNLPGRNVVRVGETADDYHVYAETPGGPASYERVEAEWGDGR